MYERILLQTLTFDLDITHPYQPLLRQVKLIGGKRKLAQVAWNFVNDRSRWLPPLPLTAADCPPRDRAPALPTLDSR